MSDSAPRSSRRRPPRRRSGLVHALLALSAAQQRTAAAAVVVLVSLGTPWYSTEVAFRNGTTVGGSMSGIRAFSFVEAAVLLVAVAVLALVWARATERRFSLPASDGTVVTAAAGWLGVLIVYRLFDRPEGGSDAGSATLIGLSWGIFASLAAVGLLLATGLEQRRRDAVLRTSSTAQPEGPVVDPGDLVPQPSGPARTARPAGPDSVAPAQVSGADEATRVAERGADEATRVAGSGDDEATRVSPATAGPPPVREAPPTPRSWSFDDPDLPAPAPATPPSRRRPTPPEDQRPLGRGDAAAQLREAGVGGTSAAPADRAAPVEGGGPEADADPTRVADAPDDATRVRPPASPAPARRREPGPDDREPAPDPETRVHGRPRRRPGA